MRICHLYKITKIFLNFSNLDLYDVLITSFTFFLGGGAERGGRSSVYEEFALKILIRSAGI